MLSVKKCKNCGFANLDGTNYCQKCGKQIKKTNKLSLTDGGLLANLSNKGFSLAPITAIAIEGQGKEMTGQTDRHKPLVKVVPLKDGRWYCPDCGKLNQKINKYCYDCGRDYI